MFAFSVALKCSCKPSAEITFNTVASSGLPEEAKDLQRPSLPRQASREVWLILSCPCNVPWCSGAELGISNPKSSFQISRDIIGSDVERGWDPDSRGGLGHLSLPEIESKVFSFSNILLLRTLVHAARRTTNALLVL